ncbi:MAG: YcnI family protein [Acetobacteraceae bacterium]
MRRFIAAAVAAIVLTGGGAGRSAKAHVVLTKAEAVSGTYHMATFRVPHGCGTSPTIALRITIPEDIVIAKPMPKPGWQVTIFREPLPAPVSREGGTVTERPREIAWTGGSLPDDFVDEFSIMVRLPTRTGPLWFPTVQVCEQGETAWIEVPPEGLSVRDMRHPPPGLTLTPPQPRGEKRG